VPFLTAACEVAQMRYANRRDAGQRLGERLSSLGLVEPVVLGLPRGGVPVAFEIARRLDAPLDVLVARKVGAPGHRELGIGALAEGGQRVVNAEAMAALALSAEAFERLAVAEQEELERRVLRYRGDRSLPDVAAHDVVLVDDGLATGVTAEAALLSLRQRGARRVVLAVPVSSPGTARRLGALADQVVSLLTPPDLRAVGLWYDDFDQTSDEEVRDLLAEAGRRRAL